MDLLQSNNFKLNMDWRMPIAHSFSLSMIKRQHESLSALSDTSPIYENRQLMMSPVKKYSEKLYSACWVSEREHLNVSCAATAGIKLRRMWIHPKRIELKKNMITYMIEKDTPWFQEPCDLRIIHKRLHQWNSELLWRPLLLHLQRSSIETIRNAHNYVTFRITRSFLVLTVVEKSPYKRSTAVRITIIWSCEYNNYRKILTSYTTMITFLRFHSFHFIRFRISPPNFYHFVQQIALSIRVIHICSH